jgi:hypothetical protein
LQRSWETLRAQASATCGLEVVAVLPLPALALALMLPEGREHLRARARLAHRYA